MKEIKRKKNIPQVGILLVLVHFNFGDVAKIEQVVIKTTISFEKSKKMTKKS